jgi:ABC-type nitrate/sulfonate/bicarbonate transport system permease component
VVAEFVGSDKGLGYLILTSSGAMKTSVMFGVLLLLSLLGIASFYVVAWVERRLCPWYLPTSTGPQAT